MMKRLEFDLLFRWFVGLGVDDSVWDHSTFSKNRDRLLEGEIAAKFLSAVLAPPKMKRLLSSDHFSVDGTLIEAWASIKSFRSKDGGDNDSEGHALDCLTEAIHGRYMAVAKAMPSSSHETEATRWSPHQAAVGQKSSPMARLKVRYAYKAARTFLLSPTDWRSPC
ncbi:hypothetical protein ACVWW4_003973 [Bradyrhizobium sp. LB7.1]